MRGRCPRAWWRSGRWRSSTSAAHRRRRSATRWPPCARRSPWPRRPAAPGARSPRSRPRRTSRTPPGASQAAAASRRLGGDSGIGAGIVVGHMSAPGDRLRLVCRASKRSRTYWVTRSRQREMIMADGDVGRLSSGQEIQRRTGATCTSRSAPPPGCAARTPSTSSPRGACARRGHRGPGGRPDPAAGHGGLGAVPPELPTAGHARAHHRRRHAGAGRRPAPRRRCGHDRKRRGRGPARPPHRGRGGRAPHAGGVAADQPQPHLALQHPLLAAPAGLGGSHRPRLRVRAARRAERRP